MVRVYRFLVVGSGSFPFRQLWRDQAWPATEKDAQLIELACPTQAPEQTICFASHAHPSIGQWREAKWPVRRVFE